MTKAKAKMGRPTKYTPEIANQICYRLASGELLEDICAPDDMPDRVTVYGWTRTNKDFSNDYAQARVDQQHTFSDRIIKRSLDSSRDVIEDEVQGVDKAGNPIKTVKRSSDNTAVQRDSLIFKTHAFLMGRLAAAHYGDKIQQEITGKDGAPFQPVLNINVKK